jgi:hypothetical protein
MDLKEPDSTGALQNPVADRANMRMNLKAKNFLANFRTTELLQRFHRVKAISCS